MTEVAAREAAPIPEGYEMDLGRSQEGWQMERLAVAICAVWWGWGFQSIVNYYSKVYRPWVILKKKGLK